MAHEHHRPFNPDGVLAYFISFRCYGTWLHGDPRGSMDRTHHSKRTAPLIAPSPRRQKRERQALKHPPSMLDAPARLVVDKAIRDVCLHRGWQLRALNVQRDHVHLVVTASCKPEHVMNAFKCWATRRLRAAGLAPTGRRVWSRHGSTKWLWTDQQIGQACSYVADGQAWPPGS